VLAGYLICAHTLWTEPGTTPRDTGFLCAVIGLPLWGGRGASERADEVTGQYSLIRSTSGEMRPIARTAVRGGVAPAADQASLSLFAVRLYSGLVGFTTVIFIAALVMVTQWPIMAINQWPSDDLNLYPGGHPLFVALVVGTGMLGLGLLGAAVRLTALSRRRGCPPNWTVLAGYLIRAHTLWRKPWTNPWTQGLCAL